MIDHCVSALKKQAFCDAAVYYITDTLKNINEVLANQYGGHMMTERLFDITKESEPERSGDEIALDIIKRAGLKRKEG